MTKLNGLIFIMSVFFISSLRAQNQSSRPAPENNAATAQQNVADTTEAANAAKANQNNNANAGKTGDTTGAGANSTPPVPQTTTSGSGSPAVLSREGGTQRDGTNNVQRATMNMAGSPAENINVGDYKKESADAEMKDRQRRSQDKAASGQKPSADQSGEINNNNRKENNALSDQNNSSKNNKGSAVDKEKKKSTKNSSRKKERT